MVAPKVVPYSPNRSGSTLRINPWRDGVQFTRKLLEQNSNEVKAVHILFEEKEVEYVLEDMQVVEIFEEIGCKLPNVEHLSVQLDAALHFPLLSLSVPPIQALTSVLMEAHQLKSLTLLGLRLLSDDLDIRGLGEALRIHPCIQWFQMEQCYFSRDAHLEEVKKALSLSKSLKHRDLMGNVIVENAKDPSFDGRTPDKEPEQTPSFWSHPVLCCFQPQWCI